MKMFWNFGLGDCRSRKSQYQRHPTTLRIIVKSFIKQAPTNGEKVLPNLEKNGCQVANENKSFVETFSSKDNGNVLVSQFFEFMLCLDHFLG